MVMVNERFTAGRFRERAGRADLAAFDRFLAKVGDGPPSAGDEAPPGRQAAPFRRYRPDPDRPVSWNNAPPLSGAPFGWRVRSDRAG